MAGYGDRKVYVEVTATTLPDGRIAPRFIRWQDGRFLPVMKASGGPSADGFEPGVKPAHVMALPYDFKVYVGASRTPRHLYLEFEEKGLPRWYVVLDPTAGDIPFSCVAPLIDMERGSF